MFSISFWVVIFAITYRYSYRPYFDMKPIGEKAFLVVA